MSRTETAELVLEIARRVLQERNDGRSVDPSRIAWAEQVIAANVRDNKTGWPAPELMQDDSRELSKWFASRLDARHKFDTPSATARLQEEAS